MRPYEDSNLDFSLRRAALYPLSYRDISVGVSLWPLPSGGSALSKLSYEDSPSLRIISELPSFAKATEGRRKISALPSESLLKEGSSNPHLSVGGSYEDSMTRKLVPST